MNARQRVASACLLMSLAGGTRGAHAEPTAAAASPATTARPAAVSCDKRAANPDRTIIERPCGKPWTVLTDGARSVRLVGRPRRFTDPKSAVPVLTGDWIWVLPKPFDGKVTPALTKWLEQAAAHDDPDVLGIAVQYIEGAPAVSKAGRQIAGDADYGPALGGQRQEGADFNDYLGLPWNYAGGEVDEPEAAEIRALDCSGFVRMVWGYRLGLPLSRGANPPAGALARRTFEMSAIKLGAVVIPDTGSPSRALGRLQAGDLVFFDADPGDGGRIDHVGIVLGWDTSGHLRYISSRKSGNGPTFGDLKGPSILDGDGLYARTLRAARRL